MKRKQTLFKQMFRGFPKSPKVTIRRGSVKVFEELFFVPLTELNVELPTLLETEHLIKHRKTDLEKLKTHRFVTYSLYGKRKRR